MPTHRRGVRERREPDGGRSCNGFVARAEDSAGGRHVRFGISRLAVNPEDVVHPGLLGGWGCLETQHQGEHRMNLHANARLSVKGRELLIDRILTQGWSLAQAAEAAGVSDRTAFKWFERFRLEGEQGLLDRSSTPKSSP